MQLQKHQEQQTKNQPKPSTVSRPVFIALYLLGLVICIPTSLIIWFVRRRLFKETQVAGSCVLSSSIQNNGMADRTAARFKFKIFIKIVKIGFLRHFVQAGHQVIWLTTMIDDYWVDEEFKGVEIHEVRLPLHPGDWFSQNIALAYHIIFRTNLEPDLIVVDHSASCVPLLKWWYPKVHIMFYCHFPQQLVTPNRFFLYRWYSKCMGLIEARMFESADMVLVNSEFTSKQFQAVMPSVPKEKMRVVYPPCDVDSLSVVSCPISRKNRIRNERYLFLSMNRFWPEKRLDIILDAAVQLKRFGLRPLIQMAGSVMPHIPESRIYYQLLKEQCEKYELYDMIEFIPDPSDEQKFQLYNQCDSVIYTPPNEHFGIVPIEALEQRRPVIVIDSGGPSETVIEGVTGTKIADTDGVLLAEAMVEHMERREWIELDSDVHYVKQRARFEKNFSLSGFGQSIDEAVKKIFNNDSHVNKEHQTMDEHTNGFTSYSNHAKRQIKAKKKILKEKVCGQDRKNA